MRRDMVAIKRKRKRGRSRGGVEEEDKEGSEWRVGRGMKKKVEKR